MGMTGNFDHDWLNDLNLCPSAPFFFFFLYSQSEFSLTIEEKFFNNSYLILWPGKGNK